MVNVKSGQPVRADQPDAADPLVDDRLQLVLVRVDLDRGTGRVVHFGQESHPPVPHWQHHHRPVGGEEGVHRVQLQVVFGVDVPEQKAFADERTDELGADHFPHRAACAVRS